MTCLLDSSLQFSPPDNDSALRPFCRRASIPRLGSREIPTFNTNLHDPRSHLEHENMTKQPRFPFLPSPRDGSSTPFRTNSESLSNPVAPRRGAREHVSNFNMLSNHAASLYPSRDGGTAEMRRRVDTKYNEQAGAEGFGYLTSRILEKERREQTWGGISLHEMTRARPGFGMTT